MRYIWIVVHAALWVGAGAVFAFMWPLHLYGTLARYGLTTGGASNLLQPGGMIAFLVAAVAFAGGFWLVPGWSRAVDAGRSKGGRPLVGLLFTIAAAALLVGMLFVMWVAVEVKDFNAFYLPEMWVLIPAGVWLLLGACLIGGHVKSVVFDVIVARLRRRDPRTPGLRRFRGVAVPMPGAVPVEVPVLDEEALAWYIEVVNESTRVARVTHTTQARDEYGNAVGAPTEHYSWTRYKARDRGTATWDATDFGIQLPDGTVIAISDEVSFFGEPVTDLRRLDRDLSDQVYAEVAELMRKGAKSWYQVFAIWPGTPMMADGATMLDDRGGLWLVNHPVQEAQAEAV